MEIVQIIIFIINILFLLYFIIYHRKIKNKILQFTNEQLDKTRKIYNERIDEYSNEIIKKQEELSKIRKESEEAIKKLENDKKLILDQKSEIINKELEEYKQKQLQQIQNDFNKKIKEQDEVFNEYQQGIEKEKLIADEKLKKILSELEDYRVRRDAINEIIRLEDEKTKGLDSHRIMLSSQDKEDINFLLSIESKLNNKEILYKLIWSEYIQKPFNIMIKTLFGSNIPKNVIYCIENIQTHKKYIGKTSAEVSKRWTEHIKTSLNIGGVKRSNIHDVLFGNWDNFTFEVITQVPKEELSEKEKYYINFFESDKYGYNIKSGG